MKSPLSAIVFASFALCMLGCASATWVEKDFEHRAGTVKYTNSGAGYFIRLKREAATDMMTEFCGKSGYSILKESNGSEFAGAVFNRGFIAPVEREEINLQFKCL